MVSSRWSRSAQAHRILSQDPAILDLATDGSLTMLSQDPAILDLAPYLSLNKLFGCETQ
jgi:hypothetical protein